MSAHERPGAQTFDIPQDPSIEDLMAQAADEAPDDNELARVAAVARKQWMLERETARLEEALEKKKKELNQVRDKELPDLMQEVGLSEFKLESGYKITTKNEVYCSMPDDPEPGFQWLRDNNLEAVIKNFVSVGFGKGEDDVAAKAIRALYDMGLQPEIKVSVHPSTLKALIKEQMGKGVVVPLELFGAYAVTRAKIEPPKGQQNG